MSARETAGRPHSARAYYGDSYTSQFEAEVVDVTQVDGRPAAILARTYFFPTSGGQPHDVGTLGEAAVAEVVERDVDGAILHVLDRPLASGRYPAAIDWARRFDHMQQHTAQHLLSQAFVEHLGAATVGFHLGAETSTIDLAASAVAPDQAAAVEDRVNDLVEANAPVVCFEVAPEAAVSVGLRKPSDRTGPIRVVDIAGGFDRSACGGTHVARTGELGLVKIRRWERRGPETRVEFVAGRRARLDYRWKNEAVVRLANALSIKDVELADTVLRLVEEGRERQRELHALRNRLLDHEADALWRAAELQPLAGGLTARLVVASFDGRTFEELRYLAGKVAERGAAVALLGLRTSDRGQIAFARSADVALDVGRLLRAALAPAGGRGGGRPESAQGGVPDPAAVEPALAAARSIAAGGDSG